MIVVMENKLWKLFIELISNGWESFFFIRAYITVFFWYRGVKTT